MYSFRRRGHAGPDDERGELAGPTVRRPVGGRLRKQRDRAIAHEPLRHDPGTSCRTLYPTLGTRPHRVADITCQPW
jgi:hypothetical protein